MHHRSSMRGGCPRRMTSLAQNRNQTWWCRPDGYEAYESVRNGNHLMVHTSTRLGNTQPVHAKDAHTNPATSKRDLCQPSWTKATIKDTRPTPATAGQCKHHNQPSCVRVSARSSENSKRALCIQCIILFRLKDWLWELAAARQGCKYGPRAGESRPNEPQSCPACQ